VSWIESRQVLAERSIEDLYRRLRDLSDLVTATRQGLRAANQALPPPDGGGGGGIYLVAVVSAALPHGGSITGQAVFRLASGSRSQVTATATIYNDGPNPADDIASGSTVILMSNSDGSYTAVGVYC
jgi:hypothetical protein